MELSIWRRDWMGVLKILFGSYIVFGINLFFGDEIGTLIFASLFAAGCFEMLVLGLTGRLK